MSSRFVSLTNPAAQEKAGYLQRHGISSADNANRRTAWLQEGFEANAVADLDGDPPSNVNTKGLPPARALLARFVDWQAREDRDLHESEVRRTDIQAKLTKAEAEIKTAVRDTANKLLSGGDAVDSEKVMAARHLAESALLALPELDEKIERGQLRVKRLEERKNEFLYAALIELAESGKLGARYMAAIKNLPEIAGLVFGLSKAIGRGPQLQNHFAFPRSILTNGDHHDYIIGNDVRDDVWRKIIQSLQHDPRANVSVP